MDGCTASPTAIPTNNPTKQFFTNTPTPTETEDDTDTDDEESTVVIFDLSPFPTNGLIITDAYDRMEISIETYIKRSELRLEDTCLDCFEWFFQDQDWFDEVAIDRFLSLNKYYRYNYQGITFYNKKTGSTIIDGIVYNVFKSYLIITSVRTKNAGYCRDMDKKAILEPGHDYKIKLKIKN